MAKLNGMKLKRATKQIETAEAHRQRHKTNEIEIERVKTQENFHFNANTNERVLKLTGTRLWEFISPKIGIFYRLFYSAFLS